jgi:hypothetical protein
MKRKRQSVSRRRITSLVVVLMLTLSAVWAGAESADAGPRISFIVEPLIQKGFGGTAYDLSADEGGGVTGLSRLEFPTVQWEAGVSLGISGSQGDQRQWLVAASYSTSVFATTGTMNDSDWTLYAGYPRVPWSYTESTDAGTSWQASAEAAWRMASTGPFSISLYGYYRYQYAFHVENGLTGWQYVWNTTTSAYDLYAVSASITDVLEYTLTYSAPGLRFLAGLQVLPGLSLELRGAYTPVYITDQDDHKLRTKLSTAAGWGNGVYVDLRAAYQFKRLFSAVTPYIALDGNLIWYSVSTTQTQYWYGNADAANGAPQGTQVTGIGHVISGTQYQVGARIGFAF